MKTRRQFLISMCILSASGISSAAELDHFDHTEWDNLLKKYVAPIRSGSSLGLSTQVDYRGMAQERTRLKHYLNSATTISRATFDRWSLAQQLAFLINLYNAWTVELILSAEQPVSSIKERGSLFTSPWKKKFIPLLDKILTLDDIEHGLIRGSGRYNDPRIHFAVNCASIGCPALRPEAYTAHRLEAQLEDACFQFLSDPTRNRLDVDGFKVSSIFKWYREDFEKNWRGSQTLLQFFAKYGKAFGLDSKTSRALANSEVQITFLDYDWKLNAKEAKP